MCARQCFLLKLTREYEHSSSLNAHQGVPVQGAVCLWLAGPLCGCSTPSLNRLRLCRNILGYVQVVQA
jgi:hypothetical protein